MNRLAIARICLTALFVLHFSEAIPSESKASAHINGKTAIDKKVLERIIKQKTAEAIKKLEKQFKLTYMAYTSTNDKGKKLQAHKKLQDLVDVVKRESKANLETSIKAYKFDINRLSDKDTAQLLYSSYVRDKRQSLWGSCQPVCQHRCLPTCNLLCCLTTPFVVPKKTVKMIEKQLALKKLKKKSKISKKHPKKKGKVCEPKCRKACLPSCKFSCCFSPSKN
ncbi:unnamed protein product [Pocillopora meandrina]|uniref:Uncharacterized protein n=1 Tax=Pocillopora meandrina TaxID=46732 RepID=A0AAU9W879_9CNID|nr:unnamed protein product [Pocillopora meandrina]